MEPKLLQNALDKTLATLDAFFKWFLGISVVIWWAGLSSGIKTITILEVDNSRPKAFAVIGAFYIVMNLRGFLA